MYSKIYKPKCVTCNRDSSTCIHVFEHLYLQPVGQTTQIYKNCRTCNKAGIVEIACNRLAGAERDPKWAQIQFLTAGKPNGLICRPYTALCAHQIWAQSEHVTPATLRCCASLPPALIPVEGAPWKRASVRCGGGEVEKKRRHKYGGLTHNSELGFESLLFCIVWMVSVLVSAAHLLKASTLGFTTPTTSHLKDNVPLSMGCKIYKYVQSC